MGAVDMLRAMIAAVAWAFWSLTAAAAGPTAPCYLHAMWRAHCNRLVLLHFLMSEEE